MQRCEAKGMRKKWKDFVRGNLWFSLCGLNCGLCPMKLDSHCPGCGCWIVRIGDKQMQSKKELPQSLKGYDSNGYSLFSCGNYCMK